MSERTWAVSWRSLDLANLRVIAEDVAAAYAGVSVVVEEEEPGTHTCFFTVPGDPSSDDDEAQASHVCEVSMYGLGRGEVVLSLELDAGDNAWLDEEADQLAEDLAEALDGEPVDL